MTSPIRDALRDRLKAAMRDRNRQTTDALRSVIAALENAEAVPVASNGTTAATSEHVAGGAVGLGSGEVPRRELSSDEERAVVEREVAELRAASAELAGVGQHERSSELARNADAVEGELKGLR